MLKQTVFTITIFGLATITLPNCATDRTIAIAPRENKSLNAVRSENAIKSVEGIAEQHQAQIIAEILKQRISTISNAQGKNSDDVVYILDNNEAIKHARKLQGVKIVLLKPEQIRLNLRTNFEYLEFKDFRRGADAIFVMVIDRKRDLTNTHSSITEYECKKVSDAWQVKGKVISVAVGEES